MACQRCSICNIGWPVGTHGCANCGGATWYSPQGVVTQVNGSTHGAKKPDATECGACGYEVTGYSRAELTGVGWKWHEAGSRPFVMCHDCETKYADRRMERALEAGAR